MVIVLIVGVLWWMNKSGAGGPSQADTTPLAHAARPFITPQTLTNDQMESRMKQERMNRAAETGQLPLLTPEQARRTR